MPHRRRNTLPAHVRADAHTANTSRPQPARRSLHGARGNRTDRACHRPQTPLPPCPTRRPRRGRPRRCPPSPVINTPTQKPHRAPSQATPAPRPFFPNQRSSLSVTMQLFQVLAARRAKAPGAQTLAPARPAPPGRRCTSSARAEQSTSEDLVQHKPLPRGLRKENALRH